MTQEEQAFVKLQIENTIHEALKPLVMESAKHRQILLGPNDDGGLVKEVGELVKWKNAINMERMKVAGVVGGVYGAITFALLYFFK